MRQNRPWPILRNLLNMFHFGWNETDRRRCNVLQLFPNITIYPTNLVIPEGLFSDSCIPRKLLVTTGWCDRIIRRT